MVIDRVNNSLIHYNYKSREHTMSLILRGTDKCKENEMICFDANEFINIAKVIINKIRMN